MGWKGQGRVGNALGALLATSLAVAVFWERISGYWEWITSDDVVERLKWLVIVAVAIGICAVVGTVIVFLSYRTQSWFFEGEPRRAQKLVAPTAPPRPQPASSPSQAPPPVPGVPPEVVAHLVSVAARSEADAVAEEAARAGAEGRLTAIGLTLFGESIWKPGMPDEESARRTLAALQSHPTREWPPRGWLSHLWKPGMTETEFYRLVVEEYRTRCGFPPVNPKDPK